MLDFSFQMKQDAQLVEGRFQNAVKANANEYKVLTDAMQYSLSVGGKRIRPIILYEFYKLCGGKRDHALNFACAIEMIHTYSLIHDDLPCMDNDDFRRGQPSCHKAFGENVAVLAGDALLTEAFNYAAKTEVIDKKYIIDSIAVLAENAGVNGMVGGQMMDILNENNADIDIETLEKIYSLKTGGLIIAAAKIGCILAGAYDKIDLAAEYAAKIGLAFQIIDDVLDKKASPELLGKPIGSDEKNNKKTFTTLFGIEKCEKIVEDLTLQAIKCIDLIGGNGEFLKKMAEYLSKRNY